jgi:serine/threonine protein kinase
MVYLGYLKCSRKSDEEQKRYVAVKKISKDKVTKEGQKYFIREVEVGCQATHPALMGVISYSIRPYALVMELAVTNLEDVLKRDRLGNPFVYNKTDGTVVRWDDTRRSMAAYGVAAGMCFLHNNNMIHRDLKAQNILLDEDLHVKVGDFGFAKRMSYGVKPVNRGVEMTTRLGTMVYMAPECFDDSFGHLTTAVDVWAYAMVVYELITMGHPYDQYGHTEAALDNMINDILIGWRPAIPESVPNHYASLISDCWKQDPRARPTFPEIMKRIQGDLLALSDTDLYAFETYRSEMDIALTRCDHC